MKTTLRAAAFTLVEVTLALGVAAFCLITIFGLLPVGLSSNQNAVAQTSAASIARAIIADLHNTPQTNPETSQTSPIYQIAVPAAGTATHVLYVSDNGQPLGAIDTNANAALNPAYRVTVVFTVPPATTSYFGTASTPLSGKSTVVRVLVTWIAMADPTYSVKPANYSGSFEVTGALDRTY